MILNNISVLKCIEIMLVIATFFNKSWKDIGVCILLSNKHVVLKMYIVLWENRYASFYQRKNKIILNTLLNYNK